MPRITNVVGGALRVIARAFAEYGFMTPFGPWWTRIGATKPEREGAER